MKTIVHSFVVLTLVMQACGSAAPEKSLEEKLTQEFERQAGKKHNINESLLLVHSDSRGLHLKLSYAPGPGDPPPVDKTYHVASIGKTFTSVLTAKLAEEGLLDYNDPVSDYLDPGILGGLFVVNGKDFSGDVRIHHLLNHTSGAADYYTEKPAEGLTMQEIMVQDPWRMWTIEEILEWTRTNLEAHFPPGEGFLYSDTGYELLGMVIEEATGMSFEQNLHERIFDPLGMKHTSLMFYSEPEIASPWPMCDLVYKGVNLARTNSGSLNRAAGGVVSNTEDLLIFIRALMERRIISEEGFRRMQTWQKFGPGIDYGYGLMRFRFIGAPARYMIMGNSGSIGAYMYYNPEMEIYFIGTFNHVNYQRQPIMFLFRLMRTIHKSGT